MKLPLLNDTIGSELWFWRKLMTELPHSLVLYSCAVFLQSNSPKQIYCCFYFFIGLIYRCYWWNALVDTSCSAHHEAKPTFGDHIGHLYKPSSSADAQYFGNIFLHELLLWGDRYSPAACQWSNHIVLLNVIYHFSGIQKNEKTKVHITETFWSIALTS